jgi:hypothetical protein
LIIQQIPAILLIHSIVLKTGKTVDDWGNESFTTSTTVNRVRVEPKKQLVTNKDNQQVTTTAMMFVDVRLSSYTAFNIDDTVSFNNKDYKIVSIDYLYTDKLHHLEIGLI